MAKPQAADPVKLIVAMLWALPDPMKIVMENLRSSWGEIDFSGADYPFDMTDYYESEMGGDLKRRLISFRRLVPPDSLISAKHSCNDIEERLRGEKGRHVNLDIGYLDHNKIVLASFKGAGQKIYLAEGVWADMVARYRGGRYCPFEWTFPDFRDGRYDKELIQIRRIYLNQLRERRIKG
ncbi:MAG: DUF4416 family protein [Acidobacteria bacterium]|nr:DUF4416 family protein [Acidobacteriota bacterium]